MSLKPPRSGTDGLGWYAGASGLGRNAGASGLGTKDDVDVGVGAASESARGEMNLLGLNAGASGFRCVML